ncbi:MAG: hypothetical protein KH452_04095 [Clostridiales bacterium]|nr:hypothetical protein [Clostridiales bacterium]
MGKINNELNNFFRDNQEFADLVNLYVYHGEKVIRPEELEDEGQVIYPEDHKGQKHELRNDVSKRHKRGLSYRLFCLEHAESCEGQLKYVLKLLQLDQDRHAVYKEVSGNSEYRNLKPETGKVMSALLGNPSVERCIEEQCNEEGGKVNMCKALEDWEREAKQQGKAEGVKSLIEKLGVDVEKACELIGITVEEYSQMEMEL